MVGVISNTSLLNMHITNLPDLQQFNIKDVVVAGDECILVTPKDMGVDWNEENKYFRSSVWRKSDMRPISLGFRKFVNYGEKPNFEPLLLNTAIKAVVKVDGSCLIVSRHKDELIVRTRGTIDATQLKNGHEIEFLKKKYPKAFDIEYLDSELYTLLFEWTTPTNRIVLNESAEPTLWLIGMIDHLDYSYCTQHNLDYVAKKLGVERPKTFGIILNGNIEHLKNQIEPLQDIEGVVIYDCVPGTKEGQILKKIKTLRYLQLHRVFTGVTSIDHIFELFVEYGCTNRENFEALLATNFDWELVTSLQTLIGNFYARWMHIQNMVSNINSFLDSSYNKELPRKELASKILKAFPDCSGIAFAMLDGKVIAPEKLWKTFANNE